MAGEKIPTLYCWGIHVDGLNIYLASSARGAVRVGTSLRKALDCRAYFRAALPFGELVRDEDMNRHLIIAVKAALTNEPALINLPLDISATPFQIMAWKAITRIPYGETRTYGEVAQMVNRPLGARAVGQAMGRNPLPLIFP